MKKSVIIVAGGKGLRMGGELPKQFIPLDGKPILMHTIDAFFDYDTEINVILVLPESHVDYWNNLCMHYNFERKIILAKGGETRFHSVKNGLQFVSDDELVAIHDGVRPLATPAMIDRTFKAAGESGGAIPVVDSIDSLREVEVDGSSRSLDRNKIKCVQTPQTFKALLLLKSYDQPFRTDFTDDASVFEAAGNRVECVAGERENLKITTQTDLIIAGYLITKNREEKKNL